MKGDIEIQQQQQHLDASLLSTKQPIELRQTTRGPLESTAAALSEITKQTPLSTFKSNGINIDSHRPAKERNSLKSGDGEVSTNNGDSARPQPIPPTRHKQVVQVATRYVSPPQVAKKPQWYLQNIQQEPPKQQEEPVKCPNQPKERPVLDGNDMEHQLVTMMNLVDPNEPIKRPPSRKDSLSSSSGEGQVALADMSKPPFMFAGVLASILGSILFSISLLCVKLLPEFEGIQEQAQVLFSRGMSMVVLCGISLASKGQNVLVPRDEIWVNFLRSVFGTAAIFGLYCSLKFINMGDSTALVFSSPIWTNILGYFILREPFQWLQIVALPASIVGIVLIAHPTLIVSPEHIGIINRHLATNISHHNPNGTFMDPLEYLPSTDDSDSFDFYARWPGIVIALTSSIFVSLSYIVLKFRKTTLIQATTFWLGVAMTIFSIIMMLFTGVGHTPNTIYELSLLLGNGFTSWLGQTFLQWAFFYEDAGILSVVRTFDVAMSFIMTATFLDEDIYWTSIAGAAIIISVVVSIMMNNWIKKITCLRRSSPPPSPVFEHKMAITCKSPAKYTYSINANKSN